MLMNILALAIIVIAVVISEVMFRRYKKRELQKMENRIFQLPG